jgi:cell division protein FtsZ
MGVMNSERMANRVQVILVITGIGATTLEEALAMPQKSKVVENSSTQPQPTTSVVHQLSQTRVPPAAPLPAIDPNNLDVPAFLRRRPRISG